MPAAVMSKASCLYSRVCLCRFPFIVVCGLESRCEVPGSLMEPGSWPGVSFNA